MSNHIFCNPLDLDYKFQHYGEFAHREGADPTTILFKDRYYMFVSMSAGFFYSDDLAEWTWHEDRDLDIYRYAPDVRQIGDYLYFSASTRIEPATIWRSKDPLKDGFEKVSEPFAFWDPNLFQDDDGRVYLYWGCSNEHPIYGCEMDPEKMVPISEPIDLIHGQPQKYGWERPFYPGRPEFTPTNVFEERIKELGMPFIEGAFMTKHNNHYYLQYATPGTELPVYGDGVYISDRPLGPFKIMPNTPFSYRPSGFAVGAGHGSTFQAKNGQWWHVATTQISVNKSFERRVGLWPLAWDDDGIMHCDQHFGDYPYVLNEDGYRQPWVMVSYNKTVTASSQYKNYFPENAVDENSKTWWCAQGERDEWLLMDLGAVYQVGAIQVNFADVEIPLLDHPDRETGERYTDSGHDLKSCWRLEGSVDGQTYVTLIHETSAQSRRANAFEVLSNETEVRYLRLTSVETPYHARFAVSGLRVFAKPQGELPEAVAQFSSERYDDQLTAKVSWSPTQHADGYLVKYGIAPDKLYSSYQIWGENDVIITSLNQGVDYWIQVDSFGEGGVSEGICQKLN